MNVRGGRNLFGKAAKQEIQKRKFREVPYEYPTHEVLETNTKSAPLQKIRRFEEFDDTGSRSGLVTYPTVHISKNYEKYHHQTGKTGDGKTTSANRRARSDSVEKSRSVASVSFKIKSTDTSVKLQNKTESFEILKSAYEDDDDDITESLDNYKVDNSSRNHHGDNSSLFKVPNAPPHSDPNVEKLKNLDQDTYDKISELLAQKELIEKQLKSIAEQGGGDLPPEARQETKIYDAPRSKHKDHHGRADWETNVREEEEHYERIVKGREKTRSTGGTTRSHSDQYRPDREAERYYDQQRSETSYPGADKHRIDAIQQRSETSYPGVDRDRIDPIQGRSQTSYPGVDRHRIDPIQGRSETSYPSVDRHRNDAIQGRTTSGIDSHGLNQGYSSGYSHEFSSSRENKDLLTLEREYQAFSETVGVYESSFSASSKQSVLNKSSEPNYHSGSSSTNNKQNLQPGYQYNAAVSTSKGLLPTPSSFEGQSRYHTPVSSGQIVMPTKETRQALLPTPASRVDSIQSDLSLQTPNEKSNSLTLKPNVIEKPFEAIKKTLNLLNIKLSESNKTETQESVHPLGDNQFSGQIDSAALDDITQSMLSAKKQLESLGNPGYDQSQTVHRNPEKYERVMPPKLRNVGQKETDDYDFCEYDSWRGSGHAKYVEKDPHKERDHLERLDSDIYYRKDSSIDHQHFASSRKYDPHSHDPYLLEPLKRSQDYDPNSRVPYKPERSERLQDYDLQHRQQNSYSNNNFEGDLGFESRKQGFDNLNLNSRKQSFPPAETKPNQPPSLMSLHVTPSKNIGKSLKQPLTELQAPAMAEDQQWKDPEYRQTDDFDSDYYNPYLDEDQEDESVQDLQQKTNEYIDNSGGKFRNRPSRFSQIDYQHQDKDYSLEGIPSEPLSIPPDRNEHMHFDDRQQKHEMGRGLIEFGERTAASASASSGQYPDKMRKDNRDRKRKSRFEPSGEDYRYSNQQNQSAGYRSNSELGHEEAYVPGYGKNVDAEQKWSSQTNNDFPPVSDSSLLLNARGSLNETLEKEANAFQSESSYGDFNISRSNHPPLLDFSGAAFGTNIEHSLAMDQPGFGPHSTMSKQPGHQPPMRGLLDSDKSNFPKNQNRAQSISRPFTSKFQNKNQQNVKPFPPNDRELHSSKPTPRPSPSRENIPSDTHNSRFNISTEITKQKTSDLSASNATVIKPNETGASGRPNNKGNGQETLNRGKRPASTQGSDESSAKQKKSGCVNCGSLDHIKCPKARKIQTEGTPKYGEQHGLPNYARPGQQKDGSTQDKSEAGKINAAPANEDKAQEKNVQRYPEESRQCVDNLRSYLQNYKQNRSFLEPVSALTSASKAYSVNLTYKDVIVKTEGEPDKFSGALFVNQSIFLGRGISDNKDAMKGIVYNTAVENLLKMTTLEILSQKDYGFPVSENGNKQLKKVDLMDKGKQDLATKDRQHLATKSEQDLATISKSDLASRDKSNVATRDKSDLATKSKHDLATRDIPNLATKSRHDSATRDRPDLSRRGKPDLTRRDKHDFASQRRPRFAGRWKPDFTRRDKPDQPRRDEKQDLAASKLNLETRDKPDLISKASTPGLSDFEFEEILRKERENKTISLRDMIAGLKAREKYREDNNMNPSLEKVLSNPKVESNAKDIEGIKCISETRNVNDFIVVQHENINRYKKEQSFDILRHSATQCGMLLQWWQKCVYTKHPCIYKCSIWLERQFLGEGYSTSYDDCRTLAANSVLSQLYLTRPVISVKKFKTPACKKTIQYKDIAEKVKILMMATGEEIPHQRPVINDWIIQICKEYITAYKDSDIVEMLKLTPGYTEEEVSLIQSFSAAMGLCCYWKQGKSIFIYKVINPKELLKKLKKSGNMEKDYRLLKKKEKLKIIQTFKK